MEQRGGRSEGSKGGNIEGLHFLADCEVDNRKKTPGAEHLGTLFGNGVWGEADRGGSSHFFAGSTAIRTSRKLVLLPLWISALSKGGVLDI